MFARHCTLLLNFVLYLFTAAWKIIKAWLPAGAVKKIKFVNKNTVDEYVHPEQKLFAWGGSDPWEYEFIEERKTNPEPDEVDTKINGNGNDISTSEEEEVKPTDVVENLSTNLSVASTTSNTLVESEHRVSLNTMANVTYSADKEKCNLFLYRFLLACLNQNPFVHLEHCTKQSKSIVHTYD